MMKHRIETIEEKIVVGMKIRTSVSTIYENTRQIAKVFMPRRHEVNSRIGEHVISIQDYGLDFSLVKPNSEFDKWIAIEVENANDLPVGMDSFIIKSGTYAVFRFEGPVSDFPKSRAYMFQDWLPNSGYELDHKVHFEILSESYRKDLPNVKEDIWIPVRKIN